MSNIDRAAFVVNRDLWNSPIRGHFLGLEGIGRRPLRLAGRVLAFESIRAVAEKPVPASDENNAPNINVALTLASAGVAVFPCNESKKPLVKWRDASTTRAETIKFWFRTWPGALVGIDLAKTGLIVVDADRHDPAKDGVAALLALEMENEPFDVHPIIRTPRNGYHHVFRQPDGESLGNATGALPAGIDIRGDGGYVIAAGCVTEQGAWAADDDAPDLVESFKAGVVPTLPAWFVEILQTRKEQPAPEPPQAPQTAPVAPASLPGTRERAFAETALERNCAELADAFEGERNTKLNALAYRMGRMVARHWIAQAIVETRLFAAADACGLLKSDGRRQVLATIASGLKGGAADPHPDLESDDVQPNAGANTKAVPRRKITAAPVDWNRLSNLEPREWLYGQHYIREYVSMTAAPGGVGKSSLDLAELVCMATGKDLLKIGYKPDPSKPKLRCWYWGGEDPLDETYRRLRAIMKEFDITQEDLDGYIFINSGRDTEIKIAVRDGKGYAIAVPVVEDVTQTIVDNEIDVLVIDPFISSHSIPENDNESIDAVVKTYGKIAGKSGCAVELCHHTRKGASAAHETEMQDARGAGSGVDAVRSGRVLNVMKAEEADKFGIDREDRYSYVRLSSGKANMSKGSRRGTWYFLKSVCIDNATKDRPADEVGVVTPWTPPAPTDGITDEDIREIHNRVGVVPIYRADSQAKMWVGKVVAEALGWDATAKEVKERIKPMVKGWTKDGTLKLVPGKDNKGEERMFVVAGVLMDLKEGESLKRGGT